MLVLLVSIMAGPIIWLIQSAKNMSEENYSLTEIVLEVLRILSGQNNQIEFSFWSTRIALVFWMYFCFLLQGSNFFILIPIFKFTNKIT